MAPPAVAQDAATAAPPSDGSRLGLGVRMAYGFPGETRSEVNDRPLNLQGLIAPQVDLSWFFSPNLSLALHGQYGVGRYSYACSEESCSGGVLRLGVGVHYQFTPERPWSAWVGAGVGYERHMMKDHVAYGDRSSVWSGFELARVDAGVDFKFADHFRVGPYVTGSMGSYFWYSSKSTRYPTISESLDAALHFWVMPGVRLQARL